MCSESHWNINLDSNVRTLSMLAQRNFLESIRAKLDDETTNKQIVADVHRLRDFLVTPSNMAAHVTANFIQLNKLKVDLNGPWQQSLNSTGGTKK